MRVRSKIDTICGGRKVSAWLKLNSAEALCIRDVLSLKDVERTYFGYTQSLGHSSSFGAI